MPPRSHHLSEVSSRSYPSLDRNPAKKNWVDKSGGLPSYIERIAKHLHYEKGRTIGAAIATAVETTRRWCSTGRNWNGGNVSAATQAKACKAAAEWEAKKAKSKAKTAAKSMKEAVAEAQEMEPTPAIQILEMYDGDDLGEAVLSYQDKKKLPVSAFAVPTERKYPIQDEAHARNALARVAQYGTAQEKEMVKGAVKKRYPNIEISEAEQFTLSQDEAREIALLAQQRLLAVEGMLPLLREKQTRGKKQIVESASELLEAELTAPFSLTMVGGESAEPKAQKEMAEALAEEADELRALCESLGLELSEAMDPVADAEARVSKVKKRSPRDRKKKGGQDAPPWEQDNPKPDDEKKKLTPEQIAKAKARAKKAGRKYPNLVDNMAVAESNMAALSSMPAPKSDTTQMKRGDSGAEVATAQKQVMALGSYVGDAGADGKFGVQTEDGVKRVQRRFGLKADGIVGPKTKRVLKTAKVDESVEPMGQNADNVKDKSSDEVLEAVATEESDETELEERFSGPVSSLSNNKAVQLGVSRAARRAQQAKTRDGKAIGGPTDAAFEKMHPRGRGGQWINKGIQNELGIKNATGEIDANTTEKIKEFQRQNGLQVDGIVGSQTAAAMMDSSAPVGSLTNEQKDFLAGRGRGPKGRPLNKRVMEATDELVPEEVVADNEEIIEEPVSVVAEDVEAEDVEAVTEPEAEETAEEATEATEETEAEETAEETEAEETAETKEEPAAEEPAEIEEATVKVKVKVDTEDEEESEESSEEGSEESEGDHDCPMCNAAMGKYESKCATCGWEEDGGSENENEPDDSDDGPGIKIVLEAPNALEVSEGWSLKKKSDEALELSEEVDFDTVSNDPADTADMANATDGNPAKHHKKPPNLRESAAGTGTANCGNCDEYENGECREYGVEVDAGQVCDDWEGNTELAEAEIDNRIRGALRGWTRDRIAKIRRLPDGTFAPLGRGKVLRPDEPVSLGGKRGKVSKDGRFVELANGQKAKLAADSLQKMPMSAARKQAKRDMEQYPAEYPNGPYKVGKSVGNETMASPEISQNLGTEVEIDGKKYTKSLVEPMGADLGPGAPSSAWKAEDGSMLSNEEVAKRVARMDSPAAIARQERARERRMRVPTTTGKPAPVPAKPPKGRTFPMSDAEMRKRGAMDSPEIELTAENVRKEMEAFKGLGLSQDEAQFLAIASIEGRNDRLAREQALRDQMNALRDRLGAGAISQDEALAMLSPTATVEEVMRDTGLFEEFQSYNEYLDNLMSQGIDYNDALRLADIEFAEGDALAGIAPEKVEGMPSPDAGITEMSSPETKSLIDTLDKGMKFGETLDRAVAKVADSDFGNLDAETLRSIADRLAATQSIDAQNLANKMREAAEIADLQERLMNTMLRRGRVDSAGNQYVMSSPDRFSGQPWEPSASQESWAEDKVRQDYIDKWVDDHNDMPVKEAIAAAEVAFDDWYQSNEWADAMADANKEWEDQRDEAAGMWSPVPHYGNGIRTPMGGFRHLLALSDDKLNRLRSRVLQSGDRQAVKRLRAEMSLRDMASPNVFDLEDQYQEALDKLLGTESELQKAEAEGADDVDTLRAQLQSDEAEYTKIAGQLNEIADAELFSMASPNAFFDVGEDVVVSSPFSGRNRQSGRVVATRQAMDGSLPLFSYLVEFEGGDTQEFFESHLVTGAEAKADEDVAVGQTLKTLAKMGSPEFSADDARAWVRRGMSSEKLDDSSIQRASDDELAAYALGAYGGIDHNGLASAEFNGLRSRRQMLSLADMESPAVAELSSAIYGLDQKESLDFPEGIKVERQIDTDELYDAGPTYLVTQGADSALVYGPLGAINNIEERLGVMASPSLRNYGKKAPGFTQPSDWTRSSVRSGGRGSYTSYERNGETLLYSHNEDEWQYFSNGVGTSPTSDNTVDSATAQKIADTPPAKKPSLIGNANMDDSLPLPPPGRTLDDGWGGPDDDLPQEPVNPADYEMPSPAPLGGLKGKRYADRAVFNSPMPNSSPQPSVDAIVQSVLDSKTGPLGNTVTLPNGTVLQYYFGARIDIGTKTLTFKGLSLARAAEIARDLDAMLDGNGPLDITEVQSAFDTVASAEKVRLQEIAAAETLATSLGLPASAVNSNIIDENAWQTGIMASPEADTTDMEVPEGFRVNTEALEMAQMPNGTLFTMKDGYRYVKHRNTEAEDADKVWVIAKPVDTNGQVVEIDPALIDEQGELIPTGKAAHGPTRRILHRRFAPALVGGMSPDYSEEYGLGDGPPPNDTVTIAQDFPGKIADAVLNEVAMASPEPAPEGFENKRAKGLKAGDKVFIPHLTAGNWDSVSDRLLIQDADELTERGWSKLDLSTGYSGYGNYGGVNRLNQSNVNLLGAPEGLEIESIQEHPSARDLTLAMPEIEGIEFVKPVTLYAKSGKLVPRNKGNNKNESIAPLAFSDDAPTESGTMADLEVDGAAVKAKIGDRVVHLTPARLNEVSYSYWDEEEKGGPFVALDAYYLLNDEKIVQATSENMGEIEAAVAAEQNGDYDYEGPSYERIQNPYATGKLEKRAVVINGVPALADSNLALEWELSSSEFGFSDIADVEVGNVILGNNSRYVVAGISKSANIPYASYPAGLPEGAYGYELELRSKNGKVAGKVTFKPDAKVPLSKSGYDPATVDVPVAKDTAPLNASDVSSGDNLYELTKKAVAGQQTTSLADQIDNYTPSYSYGEPSKFPVGIQNTLLEIPAGETKTIAGVQVRRDDATNWSVKRSGGDYYDANGEWSTDLDMDDTIKSMQSQREENPSIKDADTEAAPEAPAPEAPAAPEASAEDSAPDLPEGASVTKTANGFVWTAPNGTMGQAETEAEAISAINAAQTPEAPSAIAGAAEQLDMTEDEVNAKIADLANQGITLDPEDDSAETIASVIQAASPTMASPIPSYYGKLATEMSRTELLTYLGLTESDLPTDELRRRVDEAMTEEAIARMEAKAEGMA